MLDASRQRARRVAADARLKEKEMGEIQRVFVKDDLVRARKETEETRARLAGEGCVFLVPDAGDCAVGDDGVGDGVGDGDGDCCVIVVVVVFVAAVIVIFVLCR